MEMSVLMTAEAKALLLPVGVMVIWTVLLMLNMARMRTAAVKSGEVSMGYFRAHMGGSLPEDTQKAGRAFENLFEIGVLFYIAILFAIVTGITGGDILVAAWISVLARIAQGIIHIGYNNVTHRFVAFLVSNAALIYIWGKVLLVAL